MNHLVCIEYQEKLEQRIAELERQVASHWKTRARLLKTLEGIEEVSKLALDYEDDSREGHNKAHTRRLTG